jgi:hypothetical protein
VMQTLDIFLEIKGRHDHILGYLKSRERAAQI